MRCPLNFVTHCIVCHLPKQGSKCISLLALSLLLNFRGILVLLYSVLELPYQVVCQPYGGARAAPFEPHDDDDAIALHTRPKSKPNLRNNWIHKRGRLLLPYPDPVWTLPCTGGKVEMQRSSSRLYWTFLHFEYIRRKDHGNQSLLSYRLCV